MNHSAIRAWVRVFLWMALIFLTSCTVITPGQLATAVNRVSADHVTPSGFLMFWGAVWWVFVKGWHMAEFGTLFALLVRAFWTTRWKSHSIMSAIILASIYAATDEFHQTFVSYRGGRWSDVLIDCMGIGVAYGIYVLRRNKDSEFIAQTA
ncbi:MAG: VanZ family protein [Armatimonadetes bacterium]|nr:VanZ family protein [Armatimonadota bacterium]